MTSSELDGFNLLGKIQPDQKVLILPDRVSLD